MLTLKKATSDDYSIILSMVWTYACSSPYKDKVNTLAIDTLVKEFLTEDDKAVFYVLCDEVPVGFLAGAALPFILGLDTVATELAWWVHPESRLKGVGKVLLEAFEEWAKEVGCSMICLSSMDEETGEVYIKRGYSLKEYSYLKVLN